MQQGCTDKDQDRVTSDARRAIVHGLRQCDRCRAATRFLEGLGFKVHFHDLRRDGLDEALLRQWVEEFGLAHLINRRGTTWRRLGEAERAVLAEGGDITILLDQPSLLRRPVIRSGDGCWLGFDATVAAEIEERMAAS
ncbi:MAG: arsenate reductase [Alphaproteobacteria bacterium]|nr:MAG: arsenate reductase [Alphaproteobacteria bacterium]